MQLNDTPSLRVSTIRSLGSVRVNYLIGRVGRTGAASSDIHKFLALIKNKSLFSNDFLLPLDR